MNLKMTTDTAKVYDIDIPTMVFWNEMDRDDRAFYYDHADHMIRANDFQFTKYKTGVDGAGIIALAAQIVMNDREQGRY